MSFTNFLSRIRLPRVVNSANFVRTSHSCVKEPEKKPDDGKKIEALKTSKEAYSTSQEPAKDAPETPCVKKIIVVPCGAGSRMLPLMPVDAEGACYGGINLEDGSSVFSCIKIPYCARQPASAAKKKDQEACNFSRGTEDGKKGGGALVLGVYVDCHKKLTLTPAGEEMDSKAGGKIKQRLSEVADQMKLGKAFIITDVPDYGAVALAGIGPEKPGYDDLEALDLTKENIRWGVGAGVRALQRRGVAHVDVDACGEPGAAAEAAELAAWTYQEFRGRDRHPECAVSKLGGACEEWRAGAIRGTAQNWARQLSDTPANVMTPIDLAQAAIDVLCPLGVVVEARGREWIQSQNMQAFMAVARGACSEPIFLQCSYQGGGGAAAPVLIAAKGVTFDSGGLCLKKCESMTENRGSMAGAAVVLAAIKACAELKVPINIRAVIPCCENMISGQCMKVGDVLRALDGTSILIENTDMEGRLMLADALVYGQVAHKPELVIDVATLTHGAALATGGGAFGLFTSDEGAWAAARLAGALAGDRPWRMPLWDYYSKQITDDPGVDLRNQGRGKASLCLGAAFLRKFVCCPWMHMDITGVGKLAHGAPPYLRARRMTGRPARTLATLLQHMARDCQAKHASENH